MRTFLRLLGSLDLRGPDGEAIHSVLSQPKRCALLAYLALARPHGLHRRDTLLGLFWPESDERHARAALSSALSFLRRSLGDGVILTRGSEEVGVDADLLRTDVRAFERALEASDPATALDQYQGHLLEGFHLSGCPGFGQWMDAEQERFRRLAAEAAWASASREIQSGALPAAERLGRRALDLVGTDESAVRAFIEALAGAGDRAAAVRFYEEFAERLAEDLELEPCLATRGLANRIRNSESTPVSEGPRPVPRTERPVGGIAAQSPKVPFRWAPWAVGVAVALASGALVFRPLPRVERVPSPADTPPYTILAAVGGSAPDSVRSVVGSLLASAIDGSKALVTLPPAEVVLGLERTQRPDTSVLTVELAAELAVRGHMPIVFAPELDRLGQTYHLVVRALDPETGSLLARGSTTVKSEDQLVDSCGRVVETLGAELAERGLTRQVWLMDNPITGSFEAYLRWRDGRALYLQGRPPAAQAMFLEAVEIDPDFSFAWAWLAITYEWSGIRDSAVTAMSRALDRPDRLSGLERLQTDYLAAFLEGDLHQMLRTSERMLREYPPNGAVNLAIAFDELERTDRAIAVLEEWEDVYPFGPVEALPWNLQRFLRKAGRLEEARAWVAQLSSTLQRAVFGGAIGTAAADWDLAKGRAEFVLEHHDATPKEKHWAHHQMASVGGARGGIQLAFWHLDQARRLATGQAAIIGYEVALLLSVASSAETGYTDPSALRSDTTETGQRLSALWELRRGSMADAPEPPTSVRGFPGSGLRLSGDEALSLLLRAWREAEKGRWDDVIRLLGPAPRGPRQEIGNFDEGRAVNQLIQWTLAEAYERAGVPDSAAAVFARVAEAQPDLGFWDQFRGLTHSFAHRRAALLYGRLGDREMAIEHWRVFLDDFTEPDPEFQWMVDEARKELANWEESS